VARSVKHPTLGFSSGRDLAVVELSLELGSARNAEYASDSLSLSLQLMLYLSLSQINKIKSLKKKQKQKQWTESR